MNTELTLSQIRRRAFSLLSKIEKDNDLESLVDIAYVGMEEMGEGKVICSITIKCKAQEYQTKGIGYTPEAAMNNIMAEGFLMLLRIESQYIRAKVKELISQ